MKKSRGTGIVKVADLFEKYKKTLKAPQASVVKAFQEAVEEVLGVRIIPHQCVYSPRTHTLLLNMGGPQKTEILFKKKEILFKVGERVGEKNAPTQIL
jgi:hypothetical protein